MLTPFNLRIWCFNLFEDLLHADGRRGRRSRRRYSHIRWLFWCDVQYSHTKMAPNNGQIRAGGKVPRRLRAERPRKAIRTEGEIVGCRIGGTPNERRLFAQILAVLGTPQNPRATIVELERTTVRLLNDLGVQVLVWDEIHNVLAASWREQRVVFNTLRYLSNELKLSLVCFGILWKRARRSMATCNWRAALTPSRYRDG
ncbi:TniB family NTP-binding protein [Methylocystis rosea]|uniref:TniB family NTP-binding protein n=1 Tax=Methylocystis rosea TaxID=173366 RepID=UPI0018DBA6B4|nr:TniB family NTP-binding protein [Methylocystis rosea]